MKSALLTGATTAMALWNWEHNEEEMEKLKPEDEALWHHHFVGGHHFRLPKGFELGQLTGTLPEMIIRQIKSEHPPEFFKAFTQFAGSFIPTPVPQFGKPIFEVAANQDLFRQRPILSMGQTFAAPEQQYDAYTSRMFIDFAQAMPSSAPDWMRSPKKLEHLIKAYTTSIGALVIEGANHLYAATGNAPDLPSKSVGQLPIMRDFYRSSGIKPSRQVQMFFDMSRKVGELGIAMKKAKENGTSEYRQFRIDNRELLRMRQGMNRMSNQMSKLSKMSKKIMADKRLSGEAKYEKLQKLQRRKNALAKDAVARYWKVFSG